MKKLTILLLFSVIAVSGIAQSQNWTPQELRIVDQFNLDVNDSRGIVLLTQDMLSSEQQVDATVPTVKDGLELFMTADKKKDLIYVLVDDNVSIPVMYRNPIGMHQVVQYYLQISQ